jgi:hypothetical protein
MAEPVYKELPEVIVVGKRRQPPPAPTKPAQPRVLGLPEPVFFGLVGVIALGGLIYLTIKNK